MKDVKLLICDDSVLVRKKVTDYVINNSNFQVIEAINGEDCIEKYKMYKPNLIIMDIVMPVKTGLDALIELKSIDKDVKVIIASSTGTQEHLKKSIEAGAFDFIQKPITSENISKIINHFEQGGN